MSNIVQIKDEKGVPHYYDFGTKNESFLLTAQELRELGIKKWYQCLEVKYPNLGVQDIDPYDPNISPTDIGKIAIECKQNPWFFFREVTRVPVRGAGSVPLYLHRAGHAAIWCFMNSIDFELVQPRQTYKTTVITAIMSYAMLFEYRNTDIPYMHRTEKRVTDNIGILRDYIMALPKYMNPWATFKHPPGLQSMKYDAHNVSIAVITAAKSENVAADKTRGYSLFCWFVDECEFIPYMKAVIDGANPTIVQARRTARENGIRSCMMYASTPGDLETAEGKEWAKILEQLPEFFEAIYDCTAEEIMRLKSIPTPDEEDQDRVPITMFYIEFNYVQLRKDEEWLKEQYLEAVKKGTIGEYRRGVLLQRYRGSDSVLFSQADIDFISKNVREPDHHIRLLDKGDVFQLHVYEHPIKYIDIHRDYNYFDVEMHYLIGIDPASGKGGDNTAICIVHPYTFQVVGEFLSPFLGPFDLMRVITEIAKLVPKGIFIIETNNLGTAIVDFVQESNLAHRFYHDPKLDISKNPIQLETPEMSVLRKSKEKGYIGTYLTTQIREKMILLLQAQVKEHRELLTTKHLSWDIMNLIRGRNGKVEAAPGLHDDMVMAYCHILYVFYFGYKLERFGIDKRLCVFENGKQVVVQYEHDIAEDNVNNMIPFENPYAFGNQQLRDLTSSDPMRVLDHTQHDEYGYRRDQYAGSLPAAKKEEESLSNSDLAYFYQVNEHMW